MLMGFQEVGSILAFYKIVGILLSFLHEYLFLRGINRKLSSFKKVREDLAKKKTDEEID